MPPMHQIGSMKSTTLCAIEKYISLMFLPKTAIIKDGNTNKMKKWTIPFEKCFRVEYLLSFCPTHQCIYFFFRHSHHDNISAIHGCSAGESYTNPPSSWSDQLESNTNLLEVESWNCIDKPTCIVMSVSSKSQKKTTEPDSSKSEVNGKPSVYWLKVMILRDTCTFVTGGFVVDFVSGLESISVIFGATIQWQIGW